MITAFFIIGIVAALVVLFALAAASMLGIPLETRKGREKRAEIARQIQAQRVRDEAAHAIQVEQEAARLRLQNRQNG